MMVTRARWSMLAARDRGVELSEGYDCGPKWAEPAGRGGTTTNGDPG